MILTALLFAQLVAGPAQVVRVPRGIPTCGPAVEAGALCAMPESPLKLTITDGSGTGNVVGYLLVLPDPSISLRDMNKPQLPLRNLNLRAFSFSFEAVYGECLEGVSIGGEELYRGSATINVACPSPAPFPGIQDGP